MKDCFFFFLLLSHCKTFLCRRQQDTGIRNRWTLFPVLALASRALAQLPW